MTGFPECVLHEILEDFWLEELLFSVMSVNRFWRWCAIAHPRYWQHISLDEDSLHSPWLRMASLFILRLERAGGRPVDLDISINEDPTAVFDTLARHLYHIRRLRVCTLTTHSGALFRIMCDPPAPILESLHLHFRWGSEYAGVVTVPAVLFSLDARMLSEISIIECVLPSAGELPPWLSKVTSFTCQSHVYHHQLPNIFASWPHLCDVRLSGLIGLDDPAFLRASTWARIEFLSLDGALVRRLNPLPLSQIPRIKITDTHNLTADDIVLVADSIMPTGPLDLTFVPHLLCYSGEDRVPVVSVDVVLKCLSGTGPRGRSMESVLPLEAPGSHPADLITAFQRAPLLGRIASLSIALDGWDRLVGPGYLAHFPEVETLAVTLERWGWFSAWEGTWRAQKGVGKLELPRLRRIAFRYEHDGPPYRKPELRLADLSEFVTDQLSGVRLPLLLSLEGVEVQGVPDEFHHVFNFLLP